MKRRGDRLNRVARDGAEFHGDDRLSDEVRVDGAATVLLVEPPAHEAPRPERTEARMAVTGSPGALSLIHAAARLLREVGGVGRR